MFSRAITRSTRTASAKEKVHRASQALFQRNVRLEPEQPLRLRDVRPRVADVACALRLEALVACALRLEALVDGLAEDGADRVGQRVDAFGRGGGDVHDPPVRLRRRAGGD